MKVRLPENLESKIKKKQECICRIRNENEKTRSELIVKCDYVIGLLHKFAKIPAIEKYTRQVAPINIINMDGWSYIALVNGKIYENHCAMGSTLHELNIKKWDSFELRKIAELDTEEKIIQKLEKYFK